MSNLRVTPTHPLFADLLYQSRQGDGRLRIGTTTYMKTTDNEGVIFVATGVNTAVGFLDMYSGGSMPTSNRMTPEDLEMLRAIKPDDSARAQGGEGDGESPEAENADGVGGESEGEAVDTTALEELGSIALESVETGEPAGPETAEEKPVAKKKTTKKA